MEINVLVVMSSPFVGGAERSMLDCAGAIRNCGAFVAHVACGRASAVFDAALALGLPVHAVRFPILERIGARGYPVAFAGMFRAALGLRTLIHRLGIGLVHANGIKACLPAGIAGRMAGVPLVCHLRDYPSRLGLTRICMRAAAATIAPSRFIGDAAGGGCRIIPNGIDAAAFYSDRNEFRRAHGLGPEAFVVSMVAHLVRWKRHDLFLDAAQEVCRGDERFRFVIAGGDLWGLDAGYADSLRERAAALPLAGRVVITGGLPDAADVLMASDAIVLPSDREPFGRVVVEAWHAGVPVVVSDGGGPAELVRNGVNGLVFSQGSSEGLAEAIRKLAGDPCFAAALTDGGERAVRRYTVHGHARAVAELYRSVLS